MYGYLHVLRFSFGEDDVDVRSCQFLVQKLGVSTHLGEFGAVHERRGVLVTKGAELTECIFQGNSHGCACFHCFRLAAVFTIPPSLTTPIQC